MSVAIEPEIVTVELDRRCKGCGELLSVANFQDTPNGPQFELCRKCRQGAVVVTNDRGKQARSLAKKLAAEARGQHIKSPHITELNAEMYRLFGGVPGMAKAWFEQIQIALVTHAGSKLILDQFAEIARLAKVATEHRDSAPDIARLTDEELGKEMLKLALSVVPQQPEEPEE